VNFRYCPSIMENHLTTIDPKTFEPFLHDYYDEFDQLKGIEHDNETDFGFNSTRDDINTLLKAYSFDELPGKFFWP
jgi:hypothetical protein